MLTFIFENKNQIIYAAQIDTLLTNHTCSLGTSTNDNNKINSPCLVYIIRVRHYF